MAAFTFTSSGGPAVGGNLTTVQFFTFFVTSGGPAMGGRSTRFVQGTGNGATVIATGRAPAYSTK